ncbi:glucose-1-phosphate adenylyltransferase [Pallidibacillus thermolactis]|uniref:glucose-1-phosphate adenylyltransferase n=1 Tax=Pallidibacillus thermolactis TaxID=251051 RepID=UPI0021D917D4|nr:glucose-1-phosphate adenylyltransferase [Pallidibacillus thermolactis]MCU9600681.1 glucose-1-phosphate adenylyltransferase [Pallidibacillus thermolactis subsp. kokeshiiformis]
MKECVGMLLAGGEGKRLGLLTHDLAKPAVPFGGKYRIIDFTLSNCTNSSIFTVGVLTQYSPLELTKHIGNGQPWEMNRSDGGITVLSPYTAKHGGDWYSGTADAIYQNIHFIEQYNPKYVLVMSGDHIYQMDYQQLLKQHKEMKADATISVIEVPWEEASRFGILNTNENLKIYEFEEKPKQPKNNLASMGIYVFTWEVLKRYLIKDAQLSTSSHDFGKDIIPAMLHDGLKLYAFKFQGYWKDVGTIQSYWEANMDLLKEDSELDLDNKKWRIYTNNSHFPPQFICGSATVKNSIVNDGCKILGGGIEKSILFRDVEIQKDAVVTQSILHSGVKVGRKCVLEKVIVMENTIIPDGTHIVAASSDDPVVINQEILEQKTYVIGGENR